MPRNAPFLFALVIVAALACAAGCTRSDSASKATKNLLFVSNYGDDTVSVLDPETGRELKVLDVGKSPEGLDVRYGPSPLVAVASSTGHEVTLIDPRTLEITRRLGAGKGPRDVVFSPDGTLLYVTSPYDQSLDVVSVESGQPVGDPVRFPDHKPTRLHISPDGDRVFVLLTGAEGALAVVDTHERKILKQIPVGPFPKDIAMTPDGSRVFAASFDGNKVTVIDGKTLEVLAEHTVETGEGLLAHPVKPLLYSMTSGFDEVDVLNYETGETVAELELGSWPTRSAISPDGKFLYLVHEDSDNVAKVDTDTNEMVQRMAVGKNPGDALYVQLPPG